MRQGIHREVIGYGVEGFVMPVAYVPLITFLDASWPKWPKRQCHKSAVLYPPPQFPSGTERFRAVPSVSKCFQVFLTIFQLSSERFRAVLSNSERFRSTL